MDRAAFWILAFCHRSRFALRSMISIVAISSVIFAQSTRFIGTWHPPHRRKGLRGVVLRIVQGSRGLEGTIHFWDPGTDHESIMLNPKLEGDSFVFDVDDDYVKGKLTFSMTVNQDGKVARLSGLGGEMLFDFRLNKAP